MEVPRPPAEGEHESTIRAFGPRGPKENPNTELASKFIMGTALSYSRAGQPVDVVLHKTNVICKKTRGFDAGEGSVDVLKASKKKKGK